MGCAQNNSSKLVESEAKQMKNIKITLVQADQVWEDKAANLALYERLLADVEATDLILLPEMFQTGFSMNTTLAEEFTQSESIFWLKEVAQKKQAAIYTSLMISVGAQIFNRGVFVFPEGKIEHYDKRKTFTLAKENEYFDAGTEAKIIDYLGWKIQLQICYDLRFPEIMRNTWNAQTKMPAYDLLLFVANWPTVRSEHWRSLLKARAIENQAFVAAVNRIGKDAKGHHYSGDSCLIDALGNSPIPFYHEQKCMSVSLQYDDLRAIRQQLPFLADQ
jgi:omega-amidase